MLILEETGLKKTRQSKIGSLLPPTHMERPEWKGMTGIRRWVDDHTDGISDDRAVRYFAFASVFVFAFVFLFCICMTDLRHPNRILDVH